MQKVLYNENMTSFKFTKEDIGKYLVFKLRYEEQGFFIDRLSINKNILNERTDYLYGVYEICYHDWCKETENISYKIHLKPFGKFQMWCPDRSWYTQDVENHINEIYHLDYKYPVFENVDDALNFAFEKNFQLYPDTRSWIKKLIDKIFNK